MSQVLQPGRKPGTSPHSLIATPRPGGLKTFNPHRGLGAALERVPKTSFLNFRPAKPLRASEESRSTKGSGPREVSGDGPLGRHVWLGPIRLGSRASPRPVVSGTPFLRRESRAVEVFRRPAEPASVGKRCPVRCPMSASRRPKPHGIASLQAPLPGFEPGFPD